MLGSGFRVTVPSVRKNLPVLFWIAAIGIPFLLCLFPNLAQVLAYEREAVSAGEGWRLLTANLSHLNVSHAALNAYSTVLLTLIFGVARDKVAMLAYLAMCAGVYILEHYVGSNAWARGSSGAVYGYAVFGALVYLSRTGAAIVLSCLAAKMLADAFGLTPDAAEAIGAQVLVSHHFYGVALGLTMASVVLLRPGIDKYYPRTISTGARSSVSHTVSGG